MNIIKQFSARRSIYSLGSAPNISTEAITSLIEQSLKFAPTAFNSQSARLAVMYGPASQKLWNLTLEVLRPHVPAPKFSATEAKIRSFQQGLGTILFFEDGDTLRQLQKQYPQYQENFSIWSNQSSGMLQYMIWLAFSAEGIGASLQHYNPLIDERVQKEFQLPPSWQMVAQMPFGSIAAPADEKTFLPLAPRIKIFDC